MTRPTTFRLFIGALALAAVVATPGAEAQQEAGTPLRLVSSRVSLAGSSNIHDYTATTTMARVTKVAVAHPATDAALWDAIVRPGVLEAFEMVIPAATLSSPREGLDKNMHKALKVTEFPDIVFTLAHLDGNGAELLANGTLRIAGVARDVTFPLKVARTGVHFTVSGSVPLVMTDFGIVPPKAMLGVLKTNPKVTVTFDTVFALPLT